MSGHFQEYVEGLYNLSGNELRALAWEALLIADGPDKAPEHAPTPACNIRVEIVQIYGVDRADGQPWEKTGFTITGQDGWETVVNTMPDTPIK